MEALVRQRFGFQRFPAATAVVFTVTVTTSALQAVRPGMLAGLQRTPEGLEGDWWRTCTALFVQDGGVVGTVSNLAWPGRRCRAWPPWWCCGGAGPRCRCTGGPSRW